MRSMLAPALLGLLAWTASPAGAEWQLVQEEGQAIAVNSETPRDGRVRRDMEENWRVGGDDDDVLFGVLSQLVEDPEGNVYLLDSQLSEVQVFSAEGDYLRTIGREGEGPGEFRNSSDMYLGPGGVLGIMQVFPGKIVQLTLEGEPAGNFPLPALEGGGFQLTYAVRGLPDRVVIAGGVSGQTTQDQYLRALDAQGQVLAHFHDESSEMRFGGFKFREQTNRNFTSRFAVADDGRVAASLDFETYEVHVWKPDGSLDYVIRRPDYAAVERSADEKKMIHRLFSGFTSWNPGSTYEASDTHMTIAQLAFQPDGSLWVLAAAGTWRVDDGVFARYDVYDREGRFVQEVELVGDHDPVADGVYFARDRMYVVTDLLSALMANFAGGDDEVLEEDPEPMAVISYSLGAPRPAP